MGLGDMFAKLGLKYGEVNSTQYVSMMKAYSEWIASSFMAFSQGAFLVYDGKNVIMTVCNTIPGYGETISPFETVFLRIWYTITIASRDFDAMKKLKQFSEKSSDEDFSALLFKLHDFGARGVSSQESAGYVGMAHTAVFRGSDTMIGLVTQHY